MLDYVMRRLGVAAGLLAAAAVVGPSPRAAAVVYRVRGPGGVVRFTNVPSDHRARVLFRDPRGGRLTIVPVGRGVYRLAPNRRRRRVAYDALIRDVAARYGVEYALVKAVVKAESDFDPTAVSHKGALGLMQLMPSTAARHGVRHAFVPRENIEGGVRHLRYLLDRYHGNIVLALAAYNAGTRRVEEAGGVPPIPETRRYLARVLRYRRAYLLGQERLARTDR